MQAANLPSVRQPISPPIFALVAPAHVASSSRRYPAHSVCGMGEARLVVRPTPRKRRPKAEHGGSDPHHQACPHPDRTGDARERPAGERPEGAREIVARQLSEATAAGAVSSLAISFCEYSLSSVKTTPIPGG